MHLIRTVAPSLFLLGLMACEDENVSRVRGELDAPEVIDFGDVQIGIIQPITIDVKNIVNASNSLRDFLITRKDALLTTIRTKAALAPEIETDLKAAADEWKSGFVAK